MTRRALRSRVLPGLAAAAFVVPPALVLAGLASPAYCLVSVAVAAALGAWLLREHGPALMLVFLTVALLMTLGRNPWLNMTPPAMHPDEGAAVADQWAASGRFDATLPIVLHIVLDEMMSTGALDPDVVGGIDTRERLIELGRRYGLRTYDSIYSRFFFSGVSIPNLMEAEYRGKTELADLQIEQFEVGRESPNNAYFADMAGRGYRTAVFQSALIDFCTPESVDLCETFASHDPAVASDLSLNARTQTVYLWDTFFRALAPSYLSDAGRWLLRRSYGLDQRELGVFGTVDRFDVQGFSTWFDRFATFATKVPRGTHVFAHFLVPHSPYLLSEDCVVSGQFEAGYYLGLSTTPGADRDASRARHYENYLEQVRCVTSKLEDLLSALEAVPAYHDAIVVIHGDHGSRISVGEYVEDMQPRDLIDNFAAFFAVRRPGLEPGVDCEFTSLPQIFRRVMDPTRAPDGAAPLPVLVATRAANTARVAVPMPRFGCGAGS